MSTLAAPYPPGAHAGPRAREGWRLDADRRPLDVLDITFLIGAFIAPMDLTIFKSFTLYDLTLAAGAFLILAGRLQPRALPSMIMPAAYVFILCSVISAFRATYPLEALTQTSQFAFIFFVQLPVILTIAQSRHVLKLGLTAFALGSLTVIVVALAIQEATGANRLVAFFNENANRLGYPGTYLMPFVLCFLMNRWRARRRLVPTLLACAAIYLSVWAIAGSGSRGAALGALVSLIVFVPLSGGTRARSVASRAVAAIVVIAVFGFVVYRTGLVPPTLGERVSESLSTQPELSDNRVFLTLAGLRAFRDSPLVGTGLDNFRYVGELYGATSDQAPHNLWVQFLAQVGVIGALAMLVIILRCFHAVLRAFLASQRTARRELLWAFFASMASIMAINMTTPGMVQRHYWLIFGLGLALALNLRDSRPPGASDPGTGPSVTPEVGARPLEPEARSPSLPERPEGVMVVDGQLAPSEGYEDPEEKLRAAYERLQAVRKRVEEINRREP